MCYLPEKMCYLSVKKCYLPVQMCYLPVQNRRFYLRKCDLKVLNVMNVLNERPAAPLQAAGAFIKSRGRYTT